ncbi:unnamed protein product [Caenorhabditis sp. 36 PRJEB53466]|nr:unnamed protein product [Caenorhabditis sp. 36 PRJEB53466]
MADCWTNDDSSDFYDDIHDHKDDTDDMDDFIIDALKRANINSDDDEMAENDFIDDDDDFDVSARYDPLGKKVRKAMGSPSKKIEQDNRVAEEREANVFSKFYDQSEVSGALKTPMRGNVDKEPTELEKYTHTQALRFASETSVWKKKGALSSRKVLPRLQKRMMFNFPNAYGHGQVYAYYRVIAREKNVYTLVACHVNVHGLHRADLRFLEVNDRTEMEGYTRISVIGQLFLGDVVAVTELVLKSNIFHSTPFFKVTHESPCTWAVARMSLISRDIRKDVTFAVLENGTAIVKGYQEAMEVVLKAGERRPQFDKLYLGSAFVPKKIESNFAGGYNNSAIYPLMAQAARVHSYPKPLGTIFNCAFSKNLTQQFEIGWDAFKEESHFQDSGDVTQTCAVMGYTAAQTVFNGRFDSRSFQMRNITKNGLIIKFTLPNPSVQPTLGRWNSNNRINIKGGKIKGKKGLNAVIETAIAEKGQLLIVARMSRDAPKDINFNQTEDGKWPLYMVSQRELFGAKPLSDHFYRLLLKDSNGKAIVETLYGGTSIRLVRKIRGRSLEKFKFCDVVLNDSQCEYVQMVLDRNPMVIGSSPFGCGKSMTIVTAALELMAREKDQEYGKKKKHSQQLLVTQSNYASVNLVHIMSKANKMDPSFKFVRYVSENNWKELPDACRTDHDLPALMRDVFTKWATGTLDSYQSACAAKLSRVRKEMIMKYLTFAKLVEPTKLTAEASKIYEKTLGWSKKARMPPAPLESFFIFFWPEIIISTVDSLPGVLNSGILKTVINVQVDEASQVPEYTLLSLFITFPKACFSLIGDTRQLPPYCEDTLTGKLKDYGIGNTMERALETDMFPKTTLKYVYRCHPVITNLLSELFYEGELISGVSTTERSEFIMKRSDFWPNPRYPITVIDNQEKGYRMGTSSGNKSEVQIVKQLLQMLTKKHNGYELHARDIGVISFYSAQTSVLTEALRGSGVKCGTVDSFQGTEREVVILCCTNEKLSEFMQLANRLNVAMSRARQATIIIGNVHGLRKAKYWKTILNNVEKNNGIMDMSKFTRQSETSRVIQECLLKHKHLKEYLWKEKASPGGIVFTRSINSVQLLHSL